jgi:hypothetical protein
VRLPAFFVQGINAVVPDKRKGHRNNLAAIGWIGEHLLISGHGSIKADLTNARTRCANRLAAENPPVFKSYQSLVHSGREPKQKPIVRKQPARL